MPHLRRRVEPNPYHQHGEGLVRKALPYLVGRVVDPDVPDEALSPIEKATRDLRGEMLADMGGDPSAAQRVPLSRVLVAALEAYLKSKGGKR